MIESVAAFVVGAALAGVAVVATVDNSTSQELTPAQEKSNVAVYDG